MSLQLDQRQRAMLEEMGVRVWQSGSPMESIDDAAPIPPLGGQAAEAGRYAVEAPPQPAHSVSGNPRTPVGSVSEMDWAQLQQAVASCEQCGLCKSRKNTVFGMGDTRARWLVVVDPPDEHDDLQGRPFAGEVGKLLDNMLKAVGLNREGSGEQGVYITHVTKCRPPGGRNPQAQEVSQCAHYLRRQIALVQPQIILALGRFAIAALLEPTVPNAGNIPLGKLRSQVYRFENVPVVVSYHPAYLQRNSQDKAKAWADLCLAMEIAAA